MGAWIETSCAAARYDSDRSHPMWVRGLKHLTWQKKQSRLTSHPMWVRGLKLASDWQTFCEVVAPYVGAWIETACPPSVLHDICVAPYVGAWIETFLLS